MMCLRGPPPPPVAPLAEADTGTMTPDDAPAAPAATDGEAADVDDVVDVDELGPSLPRRKYRDAVLAKSIVTVLH